MQLPIMVSSSRQGGQDMQIQSSNHVFQHLPYVGELFVARQLEAGDDG